MFQRMSKIALLFSLAGPAGHAAFNNTTKQKKSEVTNVNERYVNERSETSTKKQTAANTWGFTPARDVAADESRAKRVAYAETEQAQRTQRPTKGLSSGFKGFTPVRDDLTEKHVVDLKKVVQKKTKIETRTYIK